MAPPSDFTYYSYDLLTGTLLGSVPWRGVQFGSQLNSPAPFKGTLDMMDPRLAATNFIACSIPNRTLIVVDYRGAIVGHGVVLTRVPIRTASDNGTTNTLDVGGAELWKYFGSRVQATDYSAPPTSGIASPMSLWNAGPIGGPWDPTLIAAQVISDAIGYSDSASQPYGNLLGGLGLLVNGAVPSASAPAAPPVDWVAVSYPFTTQQMVDTIVTQLSQLPFGSSFDFGTDMAYSAGPGSPPVGTINLSYPRRGRTYAQNGLLVDVTTARAYSFPEDGTQAAIRAYEIGGSGAIVVGENIAPLQQGYPLWERVFSAANAQSQNINALLGQSAQAHLAMYSYAPVAPTITLGVADPNLPLGSYIVGDDIRVTIPQYADDGSVYDRRFPAGMDQEWRITGYTVDVADEGDATVQLTLAQPPFLQALVPAV